MDMQDEPGQTSLDRRTVALLGLAGLSAMAFGVGRDRGARAATPEGFTVETLQEGESTIPGVGRVRLREATWAPGAGIEERPMANDMVCRMVQGDLDVTVDGEPVTRKEGDLWTCHVGMMISDKNNGSVPAVMHVLDLLPEQLLPLKADWFEYQSGQKMEESLVGLPGFFHFQVLQLASLALLDGGSRTD